MPDKRDFYEVLDISRSATPDEVKKAYRRLARQHHPDVNPNDPAAAERFKEVAEAYEVLSDAHKREVYDAYGHQGLRGSAAGGGSPYNNFGTGGMGGMSDIFEAFFGGMAGGRPDPTGADLAYELGITLEEASTGIDKTLHIDRHVPCSACNGHGARDGRIVACPACAGTGQRRQTGTNILGFHVTTMVTCDRCNGSGEFIADPCRVCTGTGRVAGADDIPVEIPAGVENGMKVRVRGKGEAGFRGARAGDLYVVIRVKPHAHFQRHGRDLLCEIEVPATTAMLGGRLMAPTLDGEYELDIPAGTQFGERFRLRGKGMPDLQTHGRGDLFYKAKVTIPANLTARQRELLLEFVEDRGEEPPAKPRNAFQRLKDAAQHLLGSSDTESAE
jgi:molecular chaperone DnaJ